MKRLTKERKRELAAASIMILWVTAWLTSVALNKEIPQALNVAMPMASATLLGVQLPVGQKKEKSNGH